MLPPVPLPPSPIPEPSNTKKCVSALKTAFVKRREKSLPSKKNPDSLFLPESSDASKIKSGVTLKRVYNVEKAEVRNVSPINARKERRKERSKVHDKKYHSQYDEAQHRRETRRAQRKKELYNAQIKTRARNYNNAEKIPVQLIRQKQREMAERELLNDRNRNFDNTTTTTSSPTNNKKSLEHRVTTKLWQMLSRDMFLLDYEKFNRQIHATNSETKKYIISVIKRCNNKELKKLHPSTVTQTMKESKKRTGAIKCAVRRRLWQLAKTSIKHSKHWTEFLAENNIILENINIDKFDLSLIDMDALGIENKVLKRTLTWLFK